MASVEISQCLSFQKFRYIQENRPGKKYQDKDFITLKLNNLKDRVVCIIILCIDAENHELIHPNGLTGVDCKNGIYKKQYAITKHSCDIVIPYIRIERMKIKKEEYKNIPQILKGRALSFHSPYKERFLSQCPKMKTSPQYDTNKVCLGVLVTVENDQDNLNGTLHAVSHVIRNASEKTKLSIIKLSKDCVPALTGDRIDIFTSEDSPKIEPGKYLVYVTCVSEIRGIHWKSDQSLPTEKDLLYNRVISYQIPRFEPKPDLDFHVKASLHIKCPDSDQHCTFQFHYLPQTVRRDAYFTECKSEADYQDTQVNEPMCVDSQSILQDRTTYDKEDEQHAVCFQENPNYIYQEDPQTKEMYCTLNMDASRSSINSNSNIVATNVDGETVLLCNFEGTIFPQPVLSRTLKSDEKIAVKHSSSLDHVDTQYSTPSHNNFLAPSIFTSSPTQITQGVTVADNKSFGYSVNSTHIKKESQSSSDQAFLSAEKDAADTMPSSIDCKYSSVPVSSSSSSLQNISVLKKIHSNNTPWQVKEDDFEDSYCRNVFQLFKGI